MFLPLSAVIFSQFRPQSAGLDSDNWIVFGIEVLFLPKEFNRNGIFLDLVSFAFKALVTKVGQEPGEAGSTGEDLGAENCLQLSSLLLRTV
jgi:hypothetical protein